MLPNRAAISRRYLERIGKTLAVAPAGYHRQSRIVLTKHARRLEKAVIGPRIIE
ncbi:unannotated protein [freshwater metagenome]|uniref:Unannotated protein n=1 Tax=freshwater metagenome TaxID=449393 RepID=A0A6J6STE2_9ZZZZ